jgi:PAS domain-containing protein
MRAVYYTQLRSSPLECLPLQHSWPISEQHRHFELGCVLSSLVTDAIAPASVGELAIHHAGCWECNLADNSLTWSGGVYDIFGLPRGASVSREQAVGLYSDESRAKMELLRAHAIRHRRGFTLDVEIRPLAGADRWMRLICAPVCEEDRVVRLHGLKLIV